MRRCRQEELLLLILVAFDLFSCEILSLDSIHVERFLNRCLFELIVHRFDGVVERNHRARHSWKFFPTEQEKYIPDRYDLWRFQPGDSSLPLANDRAKRNTNNLADENHPLPLHLCPDLVSS